MVIRVILNDGISVPVLVELRLLIGIVFPRGKHQGAGFIVIAFRGDLPISQVFCLFHRIPICSGHGFILQPEIGNLRNLAITVIFGSDLMDSLAIGSRLTIMIIRFTGFFRPCPSIMRLIDTVLIGNRCTISAGKNLRQNIPVLIRRVFYAGITVRTNGRCPVCVQILNPCWLSVFESVNDFGISFRAVDLLFVRIIVGGTGQPFSVIGIEQTGVSQGWMNHPFSIQSDIETLGDFSILSVGSPNLMVSILIQAGIPFSVVIRFLRGSTAFGVFSGQDTVPARHFIGITINIKICFPRRLGFIVIVCLFHIGVSVRSGTKLSVRTVVSILDEPSGFVDPLINSISGFFVIVKISVCIQICGFTGLAGPGYIFIFHPGIALRPPHQVAVRIIIAFDDRPSPFVLVFAGSGVFRNFACELLR